MGSAASPAAALGNASPESPGGSMRSGVSMHTTAPVQTVPRRGSLGTKLSSDGKTLKSLRIQFYSNHDREMFITRWNGGFK